MPVLFQSFKERVQLSLLVNGKLGFHLFNAARENGFNFSLVLLAKFPQFCLHLAHDFFDPGSLGSVRSSSRTSFFITSFLIAG